MGFIRHNAIVATADSESDAQHARKLAIDCGLDVTDVMSSKVNDYYTFLIPPDGSKEGWGDSDRGDARRANWIALVREHVRGLNFVEVSYGGDGEEAEIASDAWRT